MTQPTTTDWNSYLTIGLAALGAVLGVMNTRNAMSQRKVRLRVTPANAIGMGGVWAFSIDVVNLSAFPVTINEVGIIYGKSRANSPARVAVTQPIAGLWRYRPWRQRRSPPASC